MNPNVKPEPVEQSPDAMFCVQADGRIAFLNAEAEKLFGYRRDELVGQFVKHGTRFPAEIMLAPADTDHGLLVIAAVRDVTKRLQTRAEWQRLRSAAEHARLERQLQQSQRLQSLGRLAGGVAHDFNSLLGVISSYASFVVDALADEDAPVDRAALRDDIEQIERTAGRAARLVHQLLAFAGREAVQARVLNVNEVVGELEQMLPRTLGDQVRLVTSLDPGLAMVSADRSQLEQVIVNLAVNARDAMMASGGTISIKTANTDLDEASASSLVGLGPGRYVSLKVSDTGPGIPHDVIDRAFEPFFTTKTAGEGSGLGLATVYGIVAQSGGNVQINSEPDLGTTVTVLLPVAEQAAPATEPAADEPAAGGGEVVLLVEDEAALREVIRRILSGNGYRVLAVASGQQAIEVATTEPHIDMLLTDVVMPKIGGQELADRICELRPGTTVLFMSGYTQGLLGERGALGAGVRLIEKPFSAPALLAVVREAVKSRTRAPIRPDQQ